MPVSPDLLDALQYCVDRLAHVAKKDEKDYKYFYWRDLVRAHRAALAAGPAAEDTTSPEIRAEDFIQAQVDQAPEPLRRLGEWLTHILDDDQWKTAERMLLGASIAANAPSPDAGLREALEKIAAYSEGAIASAASPKLASPTDKFQDRIVLLFEKIGKCARAALSARPADELKTGEKQ